MVHDNNVKIGRGDNVNRIYRVLREDILTLKIAPGRVLDESSLAERFSVSRSPIREALIRLNASHLVQTLPNKSAIVAPLNLEEFPQYMDALDLVQRVVTRLAAKLRTNNDIAQIEKAQQNFKQCLYNKDIIGMIDCNKQFHLAVADAAKNRYFRMAYAKLLDEGRRIQCLYYSSLSDMLPETQQNEHRQIIQAIKDKDAELAEKVARQHAIGVHQQFLHFMGRREINNYNTLDLISQH